MRLLKTKQLLFEKSNNALVTLIATIFLIIPTLTKSQNYTFRFENKSIAEALSEIANKLEINIAFDSEILGEHIINKQVSGNNAYEVVNECIKNSGFGLIVKHNSYLIVKEASIIQNTQDSLIQFCLIGLVADIETNESLPYSTVILSDKNTGLTCTSTGIFSIKQTDKLLHLSISCLGYYRLDTILELKRETDYQSFKLKKKYFDLAKVNINSEKLKIVEVCRDAGHITFNTWNFINLPNGYQTDVFSTLQLLPGIANSEQGAELNIRGGGADQNLVLLDGFTIYNIDHFFNQFSVVNPSYIKNIQIYKGGFDSRYGERVSSIIDITGKSGNQIKPKLYGGINLISGNLAAEIPIGKKITFIANCRRTYNNIYSTSLFSDLLESKLGVDKNKLSPTDTIETEPDYFFYDINSKITFNLTEKEQISVSYFRSKDKFITETELKKMTDTIQTSLDNTWENQAVSVLWSKQWNGSVNSDVQTGYSGYQNTYNDLVEIHNFKPPPHPPHRVDFVEKQDSFQENEKNELNDFFISAKSNYLMNLKNSICMGIIARYSQIRFDKSADKEFVFNTLNQTALLSTSFIQHYWSPVSSLNIKTGFRINHYDISNKIYFEPRFSASYRYSKYINLKAATGVYYQYLNKISSDKQYGYNRNFWVCIDDSLHPVLKSNHFIVGVNFSNKSLSFDIEAYFKTITGLQEYVYPTNFRIKDTIPHKQHEDFEKDPIQVPNKFLNGTGYATGIDAIIKFESKFYTTWLSYTLCKTVSKYKEINQNTEIPNLFDQRHKFSFVNLISYKNWNFSTIFTYANGKPYIKKQTVTNDFIVTREYSQLPDYKRIDISVNYTLRLKGFKMRTGISIINLFNFDNSFDIYSRQFDSNNTEYSQTILINSQKITPNFFFEFEF